MSLFGFLKKNRAKQESPADTPYPVNSNETEAIRNSNSYQPPLHTYAIVYGRRIDISTPEGQHVQQILRQCEIIKESTWKINESNNLSIVLDKCTLYESALKFLAQCQNADLKSLNLKSSEQFQEMYNSWCQRKGETINAAILRAYDNLLLFKVALLSTDKESLTKLIHSLKIV